MTTATTSAVKRQSAAFDNTELSYYKSEHEIKEEQLAQKIRNNYNGENVHEDSSDALYDNLDRYGFFFHNYENKQRLTILYKTKHNPSSKRPSKSHKTRPESELDKTKVVNKYLKGMDTLSTKEINRIEKWRNMLQPKQRDYGRNIRRWRLRRSYSESTLARRLVKGVPDRWRAAAWESMLLQNIQKQGLFPRPYYNSNASVSSEKISMRTPSTRSISTVDEDVEGGSSNSGNSSKSVIESLIRQYYDRQAEPSSYDIQIDLDVPRTISGHILFHSRYGLGQRNLFHVLHAFSLQPNGYCQGMGPIAATLLCYYEPEKAYAMLTLLDKYYGMHNVFKHGFPGLLEHLHVQDEIVKLTMPKVFVKLDEENVPPTSYATKWYITLFANTVPFKTQIRFWDLMIFYGPDAVVAFSISILWSLRHNIIDKESNFETILTSLSNFFIPEDEDNLMETCSSILNDSHIRSKMDQSRDKYRKEQ
ncbi:hypothetical protein E3P89_03265 [Wallemia ichthyophaga]|uniref:Rab-GAP TBC domain-containing protein n=2 Tax=Wallemia ichthyophaga TaxID=245174 RepID=A0A4T0HZ35_WALIC|nr:TBC domain-containing protein [Wallemia ichthyophaga EXF-994]TIB09318.1 hypothetical protein E3P93_03216 [Wallemia ichthyophaga]EOR01607.1 TBC domain-containing protein [Wallemia ichthyophaga EXF-994]TIB09506.1 hypothetical protein E3P90_03247 [Wallemia ichthyophaga]TIB20342.1 hypothetical protein E3P89_03265 [Wallemia ichthyophaga]TIB21938.1 hypothetical protein E3P88_03260 [Wallemia ichthyophaga]